MASRDDGFAPTPYSVIHWMVDQSILDLKKRKISLKEATVLDVAAGDGRFLVETFKKLNSTLVWKLSRKADLLKLMIQD